MIASRFRYISTCCCCCCCVCPFAMRTNAYYIWYMRSNSNKKCTYTNIHIRSILLSVCKCVCTCSTAQQITIAYCDRHAIFCDANEMSCICVFLFIHSFIHNFHRHTIPLMMMMVQNEITGKFCVRNDSHVSVSANKSGFAFGFPFMGKFSFARANFFFQ